MRTRIGRIFAAAVAVAAMAEEETRLQPEELRIEREVAAEFSEMLRAVGDATSGDMTN